uniref:Uncharacterized protein n=1 Tax=Arundo donax TaxID=35708 RepID=A0A0A9A762_ARUDO
MPSSCMRLMAKGNCYVNDDDSNSSSYSRFTPYGELPH